MSNQQISTLVTVGMMVAFVAIFLYLVWHAHNVRRKQELNRYKPESDHDPNS